MRSAIVDPVRRRLRAATGRPHQIPLSPPYPCRRSIRDNCAKSRCIHTRHSHNAHLLGAISHLKMKVDGEALGRVRRSSVKNFSALRILNEVPSAAPAKPRRDFFRLQNAVRVHVGSESQLKAIRRRPGKGKLQIGIADVGPVYHHASGNLRISIRRQWLRLHDYRAGECRRTCGGDDSNQR